MWIEYGRVDGRGWSVHLNWVGNKNCLPSFTVGNPVLAARSGIFVLNNLTLFAVGNVQVTEVFLTFIAVGVLDTASALVTFQAPLPCR